MSEFANLDMIHLYHYLLHKGNRQSINYGNINGTLNTLSFLSLYSCHKGPIQNPYCFAALLLKLYSVQTNTVNDLSYASLVLTNNILHFPIFTYSVQS